MPPRLKSIDTGLFGWLIARAEPLLVEDCRHAPPELLQRAEPTEKDTGSLLAVPLVNDGIVLGLLSVQHTQPGIYAPADLHLMRQLGEQVAGALADARAFEDLQSYRRHLEERVAERTEELEKANTEKERLISVLRERSHVLERETQEDALTGVANRRCFMQRLAAEIDVALAIGRPLSIAIADLDHFKVVNDELGHPVGDLALRQCAALMRRGCRQSDLVARIGGEEFALILPGMRQADAIEFCETLRATGCDARLAGDPSRTQHLYQHWSRAMGRIRRARGTDAYGRCPPVHGQARGPEPGGVVSSLARELIRPIG
jgi:diguanylate cyclase (GGDEF)-like protein